MVRTILLFSAILPLLSCAGKPWQSMDNPPNLILPGVQVIAGEHCESSAIINALNYLD